VKKSEARAAQYAGVERSLRGQRDEAGRSGVERETMLRKGGREILGVGRGAWNTQRDSETTHNLARNGSIWYAK
jgi:hypothetical protein